MEALVSVNTKLNKIASQLGVSSGQIHPIGTANYISVFMKINLIFLKVLRQSSIPEELTD